MKKIVKPNELKKLEEVKKQTGFSRMNAGRPKPWESLQLVGLRAVPEDKRPYTDNIDFYVNGTGIDHDTLSKHYKKIFREDVLSAIRQSFPDLKRNFHLTLHYNVDKLEKMTLDDEK